MRDPWARGGPGVNTRNRHCTKTLRHLPAAYIQLLKIHHSPRYLRRSSRFCSCLPHEASVCRSSPLLRPPPFPWRRRWRGTPSHLQASPPVTASPPPPPLRVTFLPPPPNSLPKENQTITKPRCGLRQRRSVALRFCTTSQHSHHVYGGRTCRYRLGCRWV
jgi:hypothetical protein